MRYNVYAPIHNVQRHLLEASLAALGALDTRDRAAVTKAVADLRAVCALVEEHSDHERRLAHPLLVRSAPEVAAELEVEHDEFERTLGALVAAATSLENAASGEAEALAYSCYLDLALFTGRYFVHMDLEERRANAALRSIMSDAELQRLERDIMREMPWAQVAGMLGPSLVPLSRSDRHWFLAATHLAFPEEASVDELLTIASTTLPAPAIAELRADLTAALVA